MILNSTSRCVGGLNGSTTWTWDHDHRHRRRRHFHHYLCPYHHQDHDDDQHHHRHYHHRQLTFAEKQAQLVFSLAFASSVCLHMQIADIMAIMLPRGLKASGASSPGQDGLCPKSREFPGAEFLA